MTGKPIVLSNFYPVSGIKQVFKYLIQLLFYFNEDIRRYKKVLNGTAGFRLRASLQQNGRKLYLGKNF